MKTAFRQTTFAAAAIAFAVSSASAKITLTLDYSLDTSTFFSTSTANGIAARATLAKAADAFSDRFLDTFTAITPGGGNTWTPGIFSVSGAGDYVDLPSMSIAANTVKIYAGGRALDSNTLGVGGPGGWGASGNQAWFNAIEGRGNAGALGSTPTDFAPWGGSIVFDNDGSSTWNYDFTASPAGKNDLYSVALHELGHLLGFGTSDSFTTTFTSGTSPNLVFNGAKSKALNGGAPVPLANEGHLSNSLLSTVTGTGTQAPMMGPSITTGTRKIATLLDWAGFDDLGWDLAKPGDANASGNINFDDLVPLAQNYNASGSQISWSEGDFNYDGVVNFDDLVPLAQNYNTSGALLTSDQVAALGSSAFAADWALAQSIVPEPTSLALTLAAAGLAKRRTHR